MASPGEIKEVRRQTDEPNTTTYSDVILGEMIDDVGVSGASFKVWQEKAAALAGFVDTTEAGASQKMSDLHKNALAMAAHYRKVLESGQAIPQATATGPKVKRIERA
jgi:hypothetical protein